MCEVKRANLESQSLQNAARDGTGGSAQTSEYEVNCRYPEYRFDLVANASGCIFVLPEVDLHVLH